MCAAPYFHFGVGVEQCNLAIIKSHWQMYCHAGGRAPGRGLGLLQTSELLVKRIPGTPQVSKNTRFCKFLLRMLGIRDKRGLAPEPHIQAVLLSHIPRNAVSMVSEPHTLGFCAPNNFPCLAHSGAAAKTFFARAILHRIIAIL